MLFFVIGCQVAPREEGRLRPDQETQIYEAVNNASERYNVPADFIHAIIHVESRHNPDAVGSGPLHNQGLMQLQPALVRRYHISHPMNVSENVMGGTRWLSEILALPQVHGDLHTAAAIYHGGHAYETAAAQHYADVVMSARARFN